MSEKYDFIVVGGGHNGLACAAYLAKAGQSVVVFERRDLVGGGVMTEERTLPGFKHNTHSTMHVWIHTGPVYRDLELNTKYGHRYIIVDAPTAVAFGDGSSLIWYREKEKFAKEIEKFSKKDAKTYLELYDHWLQIGTLIGGFLFQPPIPLSQVITPLEGTYEGRELLWMMRTSMGNYLESIFESEHVAALFGIMLTQLGNDYDAMGTGIYVPSMTTETHYCGVSVGGSKTLADAMVKCIEDNKGIVKNNSEVKEIIVKNGVATGIRLSDDTEFIANKAVVCNVGPTLIFGDGKMVDSVHLDEKFLRQIKRFRAGNVALFTPHYALNEAPQWKAAEKNLPLNNVWDVCVCEDPGVLKNQMADIRKGVVPEDLGYMVVMCTKKDPTQAPPGKHTAFIWQYAPNTDIIEGGPNKYDEIKKEYADKITEHWRRYCPNMINDNILARYDDTPLEIVRRNPSMIGGDFSGGSMDQDQLGTFRPFHGYPPYRTPIENLYMCGPNCHPGGGCSGGAGYNAANVIADDLKIKKWWKSFAYIPPEKRG